MEGANSVWVAQVKDCAAEVGGPDQNVLTYLDAFAGASISVQYVLERAQLSQNVILGQQLPPPTAFGLTDEAALVLITEWIAVPAPQIEVHVWPEAQAGQPALTDERISFGEMEFLAGRAFSLGEPSSPSAVNVAKSWEKDPATGRVFLAEKIPWKEIRTELQTLPPAQAGVLKNGPNRQTGPLFSKNCLPPPARPRLALPPPRRPAQP